jgi:hypothetical protein
MQNTEKQEYLYWKTGEKLGGTAVGLLACQ